MVALGPAADVVEPALAPPLDDEIPGDRQVRMGGDRPTDLRVGNGSPETEFGEARGRDGVSAPTEQRDSAANTI